MSFIKYLKKCFLLYDQESDKVWLKNFINFSEILEGLLFALILGYLAMSIFLESNETLNLTLGMLMQNKKFNEKVNVFNSLQKNYYFVFCSSCPIKLACNVQFPNRKATRHYCKSKIFSDINI